MIVKGTLVVNPAVTVPAEAITTDRGVVLVEHEETVTSLGLIQSVSIRESSLSTGRLGIYAA
jgi:hypothetical protein